MSRISRRRARPSSASTKARVSGRLRRAEPIGHLAKFNAWGARSEEIIGSEASRPLLKALHAEIDPSRSGQFVAFLTAPRRAGVRLLQNLSGAEIARCWGALSKTDARPDSNRSRPMSAGSGGSTTALHFTLEDPYTFYPVRSI